MVTDGSPQRTLFYNAETGEQLHLDVIDATFNIGVDRRGILTLRCYGEVDATGDILVEVKARPTGGRVESLEREDG